MKFRLLHFLRSLTSQLILARTLVLCVLYGGIFAVSLWVGFLLRFDFVIPASYQTQFLSVLPTVVGLKLVMLLLFGQFGVLLSYFRLPDLYRIAAALTLASVLLVQAWYVFPELDIPPRSILLADYILSLFLVAGFRTSLRVYRERSAPDRKGLSKSKRVAIIGAGRTGASLAYDLISRSKVGLRPVVFLDDDKNKWHHQIHGIPVTGAPDDLETARNRFGVQGVIIAMSTASARRILQITETARELGLSTDIMPSVTELATGKVRASRVRPVEIEDLLGRDPVDLDTDDIRTLIQDKVVMVTGAGGSIGSELCRQIALNNPKRLVLVERCEVQLYGIEMELRRSRYGVPNLLPLIGDVCDEARMREIFGRYRPHLVFHAAAHKHVPIMEHQPAEALKNNTFGTRLMARLAKEYGVEGFILISTDKAINPTNVMGASKRLAEIFIQSFHEANGHKTRFMAVRFGNVLGSSGSVVPLFRRQIAEGGPLTVTHPEVIRYFMTIPEASGLVLQCATQAVGGEIFVLDMGKPIKIIDLARRMIQLSGYEPEKDIEIQFVGLRPGEKLFEELQHVGEAYSPTHHPRILRFTGKPYPLEQVEAFLEHLQSSMGSMDPDKLKCEIQSFVPEYTPYMD
jgi:FlaA1/EpsC-like NDP-sugar epimerase